MTCSSAALNQDLFQGLSRTVWLDQMVRHLAGDLGEWKGLPYCVFLGIHSVTNRPLPTGLKNEQLRLRLSAWG